MNTAESTTDDDLKQHKSHCLSFPGPKHIKDDHERDLPQTDSLADLFQSATQD